MNIEKLKNHLNSLKEKHKDLELDLMEADAHWDEMGALKIKKEKLKVKDEIEKLKKELHE